MVPDPTDEIREIRRKLSEAMGNDIHRIAEDTRRRQRESGREYISLPKREPTHQSTTTKMLDHSGSPGVPPVICTPQQLSETEHDS